MSTILCAKAKVLCVLVCDFQRLCLKMKIQNPHLFTLAFALTLLSNAFLVMVLLCQTLNIPWTFESACPPTELPPERNPSRNLETYTDRYKNVNADIVKPSYAFGLQNHYDKTSLEKDSISRSVKTTSLNSFNSQLKKNVGSDSMESSLPSKQLVDHLPDAYPSTEDIVKSENVDILIGLLNLVRENSDVLDFLQKNGYLQRKTNEMFDDDRPTHSKNRKATNANEPLELQNQNSDIYFQSDGADDKQDESLPLFLKRLRRHVEDDYSLKPILKLKNVFSAFTESEIKTFKPPISEILVPSLIQFEKMVYRQLENLHAVMVSQDLRLERLEKKMLNMIKERENRQRIKEPQADVADNKSQFFHSASFISEDGIILPGNITLETLEFDGSGDGELASPTTTTAATTERVEAPPIEYYDMLRDLKSVSQKVMNLENYNLMSDSELTRIRSEVGKMDDKVAELDRQQRNYQVRASMHNFRLSQLESYVARSEMVLNTATDSYSRANSRLETFKDRLTDFKAEVHSVNVKFLKHDQIANELRAADSYKAHDISELRKSLQNVETRLNDFYILMDQTLESSKNDIRSMLERLCFNNRLLC